MIVDERAGFLRQGVGQSFLVFENVSARREADLEFLLLGVEAFFREPSGDAGRLDSLDVYAHPARVAPHFLHDGLLRLVVGGQRLGVPELSLAVVRLRSPVSDGDAESDPAGEGVSLVLELLLEGFVLVIRESVVGCRCVQIDFGQQILFRHLHVDFSFVDFDAGVLERRMLAQGV